jgi:hypothetical protein
MHVRSGHVSRDKRAFLIAGRQSLLHDAQHYLEGRVALVVESVDGYSLRNGPSLANSVTKGNVF